MMTRRMLPAAWVLLVACGPSTTQQPDAEPPTASATPTAAAPEQTPTATPTAAPQVDTASFGAAPSAEIAGSTVRLTYEGGTYTLSESALVPSGKAHVLRFAQPAADGAHVLRLTVRDAKVGVPAKIEGKDSLFLQLTDGKNTDGTFKLVDVSKSCAASGMVTFTEIAKVGGKAKGSVDVTITCQGVDDLRAPITLKGDFSGVPVAAK